MTAESFAAHREPIMAGENEIPLPPPEMWADLDNSGVGATEDRAEPKKAPPASVVLEFIGEKKPFVEVPLTYPFRWDGRDVTTIVVRRLTVQQLGDFWDSLPEDRTYDRTEVYGLMCGLPGAVIRSLPDPDGQRVTEAAFDFLPRGLGGESD